MRMKNFFFGCLISTISFSGLSQSNSIGINGGFGHSWIKNQQDIQFNPAGNFGLAFVHSTKSSFGFGADLKFSSEGGQEEYTSGSSKFEHTTDFNYLRVPLKAIFFFGRYGQKVRPKIHIGPSIGLLIGANDKILNTANGSVLVDKKSTDDYHNLDVGLNGGIGFNYRLVKNTWFTTDLNYYSGFTGTRKTSNTSLPRYINNNIALNIGVNWGIGK